uniref:Uncharacterized protein n=1 Tax=Oryza meridionalis TaxID=40149 RepID=A0A0E0EL92_9ORYZ
ADCRSSPLLSSRRGRGRQQGGRVGTRRRWRRAAGRARGADGRGGGSRRQAGKGRRRPAAAARIVTVAGNASKEQRRGRSLDGGDVDGRASTPANSNGRPKESSCQIGAQLEDPR